MTDGLDPVKGLCTTCRHCRMVAGARSAFYLCERSFTDPRFPKYPPLPVVRCEGYERRDASPAIDEKHGKLK